jgi:tetratricopeptide (TPR) repeat protein
MTTSADKIKAEQLYNEANINARLGMFDIALSLYDEAISLDRSCSMYFNNRAATLKRLGRLKEAIEQYEQITLEFPNYGKAFLSIASTSIEIGNQTSAVSCYQKFISAYNEEKFTFNPVVGGLSQEVEGVDLLQAALLTSINYLTTQQQTLAIQAFQEAINE